MSEEIKPTTNESEAVATSDLALLFGDLRRWNVVATEILRQVKKEYFVPPHLESLVWNAAWLTLRELKRLSEQSVLDQATARRKP